MYRGAGVGDRRAHSSSGCHTQSPIRSQSTCETSILAEPMSGCLQRSLSQTPLNAWGVGPFVIEEYSITGVHSGKLYNAPPSGHALRLHFVDIDEVREGKVVRTWTYGNSLELYAETGAVPHAAPGAP